jgi:hypothetical protein
MPRPARSSVPLRNRPSALNRQARARCYRSAARSTLQGVAPVQQSASPDDGCLTAWYT